MCSPRWHSGVLLAAGLYNGVFGVFAVVFPNVPFRWIGMALPRYPELWQCIGMIVGVYGVAYIIAARDPVRYWPIVFAGLLGKLLGPVGFLYSALQGRLPWVAGLIILTNDIVWWIPFGLVLANAYRKSESVQ